MSRRQLFSVWWHVWFRIRRLGVLQIAPTDLGQVEIIKGAASALYGPSALGGVINRISRRPADALEAEVLANATTRGCGSGATSSSPGADRGEGAVP
jgi:iron complex outermembrane receptor protein